MINLYTNKCVRMIGKVTIESSVRVYNFGGGGGARRRFCSPPLPFGIGLLHLLYGAVPPPPPPLVCICHPLAIIILNDCIFGGWKINFLYRSSF